MHESCIFGLWIVGSAIYCELAQPKQSGPFKITKDINFTVWSRSKEMSSDQWYFNWKGHLESSWKQDIFLLQNEESCCNGAEVQEALKENLKKRKSRWNDQ